jgi:hypothetical protein
MNNKTRPSRGGSSTSPERLTDNPSTHHHDHCPNAPKEAEEEAGEEVEEEAMEEADYLLQLDQACSHHTDELLTLTNSWAVNQRRSQEIERRSSPSLHSGNYTAE